MTKLEGELKREVTAFDRNGVFNVTMIVTPTKVTFKRGRREISLTLRTMFEVAQPPLDSPAKTHTDFYEKMRWLREGRK